MIYDDLRDSIRHSELLKQEIHDKHCTSFKITGRRNTSQNFDIGITDAVECQRTYNNIRNGTIGYFKAFESFTKNEIVAGTKRGHLVILSICTKRIPRQRTPPALELFTGATFKHKRPQQR